jgi:high-affinity nickel permease
MPNWLSWDIVKSEAGARVRYPNSISLQSLIIVRGKFASSIGRRHGGDDDHIIVVKDQKRVVVQTG